MPTIIFAIADLNVRGTCVALYDYALYNETLLGNKSIILTSGKANHNQKAVRRFENRFPVVYYTTLESFRDLAVENKADIIYFIKYGRTDPFNTIIFPENIKLCNHCVFDMSEPHGHVYTGVSKEVALKYKRTSFVPHMISIKPDDRYNMREKLGIPKDAVVFGRYGGDDTFNLNFCKDIIRRVSADTNKNIYFLFANTNRFTDNKKCIFLESLTDMDEKNRFIQTCDAYIECGTMGHSFGLAIGEFNVSGRPIIAYRPDMYTQKTTFWNDAHIKILGDTGIYFETPKEFENAILKFEKKTAKNMYTEYTPEKVMAIFKSVFID